ncbi:MAG TPA: phosphatase PAP2 family protein [Ilumatobacteraceae bacterium]
MAVVIALAIVVIGAGGALAVAELQHPASSAQADGRAVDGRALAMAAQRHPRLHDFLAHRRDPAAATGLLLTVGLTVTSAAVLAVGSVLEMVTDHAGLARWDAAAARWGADHATTDSTHVLKAVTTLGTTEFAIAIVAACAVVDYLVTHQRAVTAFLAAVLGSELLVNNVVKLIVDRKRPDIARLVHTSGTSFPSGHTATAAATYAALALIIGRHRSRRTRALLGVGAVVITIAVATSRVLLGAHWLTDVVAGMAVGWGCFALCSTAFGGRILRFGRPVETAERIVELVDSGERAST